MDWRGHEIIVSVIRKLREHGSWAGKTHIIKTLYLLSATKRMKHIPFDFTLYKHGPYTFDVEDALAIMKSYGAIEEDDIMPGFYGERLKPGVNANFPQNFAKLTKEEQQEEQEAIEEICKLTGKKNVRELECLATAVWIFDQEKESNTDKIAKRVHELKPHISKQQAKQAYNEIKHFLHS